jgi:hypothetical protein
MSSPDSRQSITDAAIIKVGQLFFVTAEAPAMFSRTTTLILPEAAHRGSMLQPSSSRGNVDILFFNDRSYFALLVQPEFELSRGDRDKFVQDVLRHAWDGLVGFGTVSGDMPQPVEGDPRQML